MKWVLAVLVLALALPVAKADDTETAREHFRKGRVQFELGHFKEAAAEFEAAFLAKDDPVLLYNLGKAQQHAGMNAAALRSFRAYLARLPRAPNRAEVEGYIQTLTRTSPGPMSADSDVPSGRPDPAESVPSPAPRSTTAPQTTPAPHAAPAPLPQTLTMTAAANEPKRPIYRRWWLWTAVGGVVAAGVAVGLGVGLSRDPFQPTLGTVTPPGGR